MLQPLVFDVGQKGTEILQRQQEKVRGRVSTLANPLSHVPKLILLRFFLTFLPLSLDQ